MVFSNTLLIQFAKAPVLGQVKTRMQPVLTEEQSLALHCQLVRRTHETIHSENLCRTQLWISGKDNDDFFQSLSPSVDLKHQCGNGLGERMYWAIQAGLENYQSVVLVGSDCPAINNEYLRDAITALKHTDVVLGPAQDGGYVLIGMNKAEWEIFDSIDWSTSQVLHQTRARLKTLNLEWLELPPLSDIDRPSDLAQIAPLSSLQ